MSQAYRRARALYTFLFSQLMICKEYDVTEDEQVDCHIILYNIAHVFCMNRPFIINDKFQLYNNQYNLNIYRTYIHNFV